MRAHGLAGLETGLVHGFSTRVGGVSGGAQATSNLGGKAGDQPANVAENLRRLAAEGSFDAQRLVTVRQVHGAMVVRAHEAGPETEADGIWIAREDGPTVVAVRTADCVPVLLTDRMGRVAAAVHSGWRGTVAGVVPAAVDALRGHGVEPAVLRAALGPCIEWPAFEVGPEVAEQFDAALVHRDGLARPHVDLVEAVRRQLVTAGIPADAIERVGACTYAHPNTYFSYRRDGGGTGQHLSFIGFAA